MRKAQRPRRPKIPQISPPTAIFAKKIIAAAHHRA